MSEPFNGKSGNELSPLKRALLAIERLQARVDELEAGLSEPVAIVGTGCRFPGGARNAATYFELLRDSRDAVSRRPPHVRPGWPETAAEVEEFPFPPAGYIDDDITTFDPVFFGISPREAASIDPQQRLLLEVSWEALEDAGIDPRALAGTRSGVFVGITGADYAQLQLRSERALELLHSHFASGVGPSMASGRLAYLLGLHGPAITVDTACSSSLVSVHLACQSLQVGDSDLAIAGGTNLILSGDSTRAFASSQMLAPDGRCKTFDASANGFGRGEGCGVIVLKRLADARRDGDRIAAVIRGSAVNQDGASSGLTAPSGAAQEAVIKAALRQAGLRPDDIDYIEAHGTGTSLGDPIEVRALGAVFGKRETERRLLVGSVKTNFGHLEATAGIAGLIKVIEILRHREVPPHQHFREPSPHIPWSEIPIEIPTGITPLDNLERPVRGAVSSFGFSGTNAHVILEAAEAENPAGSRDETAAGLALLPLSAPTEPGLRALAERYVDHLAHTDACFADVCHTAAVGRAHFAHRLTLLAENGVDARDALSAWGTGGSAPSLATHRLDNPDEPVLAFLFTGQGSQYPGMGAKLAAASPVARRALQACDEILADQLEVRLSELMDPTSGHAELIHRTDLTQPALFALQYALVCHWQNLGVEPSVVAGHSIGEFVAAHLAGVFSLEHALSAVVARGRAMHAVGAEGRMLALMAPEARVRELVESCGVEASLAAINAPTQIVVSGGAAAIDRLAAAAPAAGIEAKMLRTSQAFHSSLMDSAVDAFDAELRSLELVPGDRVRFVSTVTGAAVRPEELADRGYWARQLRQTVRFTDAVTTVAGIADRGVEIGPHPALCGLVAQGDVEFPLHASLHRERDARETLLGSLADLYRAGVQVRWAGVGEGARRKVALPTFPFQRSHLWVDLGRSGRDADAAGQHPLLGRELRQPGSGRTFQSTLRPDRPRFIDDHRVLGEPILPGTALLELLRAAGQTQRPEPILIDVLFRRPMTFADGARRVHVSAQPDQDGRCLLEVHSSPDGVDGDWTLHATARVAAESWEPAGSKGGRSSDPTATVTADDPVSEDPLALRGNDDAAIDAAAFYERLAARGYEFGPRLRGVERVWVGEGEALARISLPAACADENAEGLTRPLLLDAALQAVGPALGDDLADETYLPVGIEHVAVPGALPPAAWARATVGARRDGAVSADVTIYDDAGAEIAALNGVDFRAVSRDATAGRTPALYDLIWAPLEDDRSDAATTPERFEEVGERLAMSLARQASLEPLLDYDAYLADLESRAGDYVLRAFSELGWQPEVGEQFTLEAVAERLSIVAARRRLFRRLLEVLVEEGFLRREAEGWCVLRPLERPVEPSDRVAPDAPPERLMLDRCGPYLADNLRGLGDPLELLFPGGDVSVAERMYADTPFARVVNGSVAETVVTAWQAAPAERPFRVLEVGAGTAATTRHVLDRAANLEGDGLAKLEYTFTDISPLFVERARRRFGGRDEMRFAAFDLDLPPREQGLAPGDYDVVIAMNCLHAARELQHSLANVRRLLRPGGWLIGAEVFTPYRLFDLTVGLTDGWWHFTDDDLRRDYACLPATSWQPVLEDAGFEHPRVLVVGDHTEADGIASAGQGLVLARRRDVLDAEVLDGPWLIVGDDELGAPLRAALAGAGAEVDMLRCSELIADPDPATLLQKRLATRSGWQGILHCGAARTDRALSSSAIRERLGFGARSLLDLVRAVIDDAAPPVERLRVVTRGAQAIDEYDAEVDPSGAAVWGLARTIALEIPELDCRCLDLDPVPQDDDGRRVIAWLAADSGEAEVALRRGTMHVPRLDRWQAPASTLPPEYRLAAGRRDSLDDLAFDDGKRRDPGANEVEIRVAATGLNFKDVLGVLGMYPGDPGPLGSECAGVVTRAGEGVRWRRGDEVIASAGHAFGRHVVADARMVAAKPAGMTFAEAATLPVAYLTAYFALHHLGGIGPDDRVLIHAAAGGVGSAACELARRAGAEIFATAGSDAKREVLRAAGIGNVFDSRSDAFVEQVMEATGGAGVTMVLNSLAGDLVDAGFAVIARGGRFLEIGKRGIWTRQQVAALDRDLQYHVIDWGETFREDPELVARLLQEVMAAVEEGSLAPLPATRFPLERVVDAFRFMQQAKHVGKVVIQHPVQRAGKSLALRADAAYLITGGTSGLGLETAAWAAERGAGALVLAARRSPSENACARIDKLREAGVDVRVRRLDVGDAQQVDAFSEWAAESLDRPIRGVFHGAGALADCTLRRATWEDFEAVFHAKVKGAALLAEAMRRQTTDFFIAYSSIAGLFGSPAQANHAAANAALDALTANGWSFADSGVSLSWGPWADTGAAARDDVLDRTRQLGIGALTTEQGLACVDAAFASPQSLFVATRIESPEALGNARGKALVARLVDQSPGPQAELAATGAVESSLVERLAAVPVTARRGMLAKHVFARVRGVLALPDDMHIDGARPLGELGLDSLLAVELRNVLGADLGTRLPSTVLFDYPTADALCVYLLEEGACGDADSGGSPEAVSGEPGATATDALSSVEALSEEEVDRLLAERLHSHE